MAKHVLSLEVPDLLNLCIMRIQDTSTYATNVPFDCPKLQITAPGFWQSEIITDLEEGFTVNLTACDLGLQLNNCDNYQNNLSDGLYIIKHSVAPNDIVFVEYNHLRISAALNKYQKLLCCLDGLNCDPPIEIKNKIKEAQYIRTLFDAAKAKVEFCHKPKEGMAIYKYALARLEKLACGCNCVC